MVARYNPEIHHRRSIRLKGYDYSREGMYFVTICARKRACLFGEVVNGKMVMNETGARVQTVWDALPSHYPQVRLDAFAIMPNHIHAIVALPPAPVGAQFIAPNSAIAVGEIVREFKARCTHTINQMRNTRGVSVWQRNYYEHIIRDEADYTRIAEYIYTNPQRWTSDTLHPDVRARFIAPNSAIAPNPGAPPFHDVRTPFIAPNAIAPDSDDGIKTGDMKKGNGVVNRGDQGAMNRAPTDGGCNE